MLVRTLITRRLLSLVLLLAGSVAVIAAPKVMPQEQAAHFCRLLLDDNEGHVYPLSMYAQHLTMLLCGEMTYQGYTAEQVFTGLIFFYDDWQREPLLYARQEGRLLAEELHSGQTLRVFPHADDKGVVWYAPTVEAEHRKYMHEVFARLNGEVQAGQWERVDQYVDRMIQYQCQYGGSGRKASRAMTPYLISIIVLFLALPIGLSWRGRREKDSKRMA